MSDRGARITWLIHQVEKLTPDEQQGFLAALNHRGIALDRGREIGALLTIFEGRRRRGKRQSAPETIEQDAEIYEWRNENPKRRSWTAVGRKFNMTESGARQAYDRHQARLDGKAQ
jgi:hypothetical protein